MTEDGNQNKRSLAIKAMILALSTPESLALMEERIRQWTKADRGRGQGTLSASDQVDVYEILGMVWGLVADLKNVGRQEQVQENKVMSSMHRIWIWPEGDRDGQINFLRMAVEVLWAEVTALRERAGGA